MQNICIFSSADIDRAGPDTEKFNTNINASCIMRIARRTDKQSRLAIRSGGPELLLRTLELLMRDGAAGRCSLLSRQVPLLPAFGRVSGV